jgi:hypothetical protein
VIEHDQIDAPALQQIGQLEQVRQRSAEPIELGTTNWGAGPVRR